jgi:hypothetical protein
MEVSSEEEQKKTETSFSSNEIREEPKQVSDTFLVKVAQKEKSQQTAVIPLVTMKVVLPNN